MILPAPRDVLIFYKNKFVYEKMCGKYFCQKHRHQTIVGVLSIKN